MKLKLLQGKFRILTNVLAATVACGLIKYGLHRLGWEPFTIPISPYFTTILTGTIFLLGFILAGVMTDYKKSEAIPGKMVSSLYTIWQEAEMLIKASGSPAAKNLQKKICHFIDIFKTEFLLKRQEETTVEALYSFSEDFAIMDKDVPPGVHGKAENRADRRKRTIDYHKIYPRYFLPGSRLCHHKSHSFGFQSYVNPGQI